MCGGRGNVSARWVSNHSAVMLVNYFRNGKQGLTPGQTLVCLEISPLRLFLKLWI